MHPIKEIETFQQTPMTKPALPAQGRDASMAANLLIAEVMAHVRAGDKVWHGFAVKIIEGTTDFRAAFVNGLGKHLSDMRKANTDAIAQLGKDGKPNPTKEEQKIAGKRVGTATTYTTHLRHIAKAFNAGATVEGLMAYVHSTNRSPAKGLDEIGFTVIKEYADTFKDSDARGRPADPFTVKLSKWLDKNPAAEGDKTGAALHAVVAKLVAEQLAKDQAI